MKSIFSISIAAWLVLSILGACKKSNFLDAKPDDALLIPETLADLQAVMDNDGNINGALSGKLPDLLTFVEDNFYLRPPSYTSANLVFKNCYTWADKPYAAGGSYIGWNSMYNGIFYCNYVLEQINQFNEFTGTAEYNALLGNALFVRAHDFYFVAQAFAPPYIESSANQDKGIILRLTSNINENLTRSTVAETYAFILKDLKQSAVLLPSTQPYPTRPTKVAAYAMLARVYQTMNQHDSALYYSNQALALKSDLINFNTLPSAVNRFARFNKEVIFHVLAFPGAATFADIDTTFYRSFHNDDLRKTYFFRTTGNNQFIGSYDGSARFFGGLAVDELYLIRAESYARKGMVTEAMKDLNDLLITRWRTGQYTNLTASTPAEALAVVLAERRKELCFRALRSTDIRRLNVLGANISINRVANGQTYTLPANSNKFTWPIPDEVISFNPSLPQNPR